MKTVNKIYIIIMSIAIVLLASCFVVEKAFDAIDDYGEEVSSDADEAREDGEIDDVEGWGLIAEGSMLGLGAFAGIFLLGAALAFGIYAVLLILIATIARLLFKPQGVGLGLYRVLMTIEYILMALLDLLFISILLEGFSVLALVGAVVFTFATVYGLIYTYSRKITQ